MRYCFVMIKSFKGKSTEKIWIREKVRAFPPDILIRARRKLLMLDVASTIDDLKVPASNRLETLRGNRRGSYSIRINRQWRVCFDFVDGNAFNVEIVDYH